MAKKILPSDILVESRSRIPLPDRDKLDDAAKAIYDHHEIPDPAGKKSLAGLFGPGGLRLHSKKLSALTVPAAQYLRHEADYTPQIREVAILITAKMHQSQFEWAAHETEALRVGLNPKTIDIIRNEKSIEGVPEDQAVLIEIGRQLFATHKLDSKTFAKAHKIFGTGTLVDLVSLMGNYACTAALLAAFDVQLPEGAEPGLPED
ncbi:MAG: hypothetical protein VX780_01570 [Pseudomonadota bacterium]|jgi:4-carboxymuconolactone decarboxylase|nr:hypothetical protein [Pseudomonadota bacterium]